MTPPDLVRVLAVDDVPENLIALEALLRDEGVQLLQARSGIEALELLLVHDVALALLDVQMPGMDGFELAELMRGAERTRRVPIIFLTAVGTDERRRFRGYEAGAVDYLFKPVDPQVVRSKVEIFVELYRQRAELARQRDEHAAALARLTAHRDNSPLAIVELDREQRIIAWSQGAERLFGWRSAEVAGFRAARIKWICPDDDGHFAELLAGMIDGATERATRTLRFCTAEGYTLDCECYCSALRDAGGRLMSINVQMLDVTERKRAEETQRLLVGELNHRVKNTLASVQAIAQQTLRHSSGPSDFAPTFLGRVQALARAHSLLSSATWQGASLRELIAGQAAIGTFAAERLAARGPDIDLAPEPALHLALVLHELVTNAHKYGALSVPAGSVGLTWRVANGLLELDWIERGGPALAAPTHRGFGTALIERSLRADGGSATATYDTAGIVWRLTLPYLGSAKTAPIAAGGSSTAASSGAASASQGIKGLRLVIVEDEPLIALELTGIVEDAGAVVVGAASDPAAALRLIADLAIDGVILDGNLQGQPVDAVADALASAGIPFLFVSGYGRDHLPVGHLEAPLIGKPFDAKLLLLEIGTMCQRLETSE
ncbi:response regulator [Novosphingobium sp. PS1R-30]|uniref:histidine kinase n=1 Tax=Novosphingobium anseongense TaxID=3133436 RepID=A0ABU8RPU5_9SPHN